MKTKSKRITERKSVMGLEELIDLSARTASDISVSPERALRCVPVFAGVKVRCETLGSLPFILYKRRSDQGKDRATDHPLYRLIHDRPNAWTSAAEFVMALEKDTITHGGGYALANRSGDKIMELIRFAPGSVTVETDDVTLEPRYKVTLKCGKQTVYDWRDILHVPALDGLSAIRQAREAIGLYIAMEKHASLLFGSGARPAGILKTKGKLSEASYERIKKSWASGHSGDNAGRTAILEDGADFAPLTFSSVDLEFKELRGFQLTEIARALGVPPMLLMDFGRATWSNSEQMAQAFLTFTILPRIKLWQGAVARLLAPDEQETYFAEFLVDDLVKADIAARFAAYAQAVTTGILNPNEIRAMENRSPYVGGDEFRVSANTQAPGTPPKPPIAAPKATP